MITLAPISKNIQNTLMQKIAMMKKGQGGTVYYDEENKKWKTGETHIGTPVTETEGTPVENYMFTRTPWIRMTSFTPAAGTNNTAVVLMGTELGGDVARKGQWKDNEKKISAEYSTGRMRSGFENRTVSDPNNLIASDGNINYQGLYNIDGELPYRPISGIKDMSVDYRGAGMRLGATRTGEINWTSWDFEQLQNLTPHFLQHGKTVLLEWGWSGVGVLRKVSPIDIFKNNTINFDDDKILELNSTILTEIQKQNGHYDAMLGLIQNFTWTVRSDGGIDCTTNIIAPGITLFQSQQKKMYANQFAMLPSIVEKKQFGTKNFWVVVPDMRTVLKTGKDTIAALAPYITFQEYMADFPQQILFNLAAKGLTWENAFGRIRTTGMGAEKEDPSIGEIGDWNGHQIIAPYKMNFKDKYVKASKKEPGFVIVTPSNQTADGKHFMDNYKLFLGTSLKEIDKWISDKPEGEGKEVDPAAGHFEYTMNSDGSGFFVTWGWFEDNVLSRFFGQLTETDSEQGSEDTITKKIIGEFRSIEPKLNRAGKIIPGKYASIKFRNSRYLMTTDMSKWLIPNMGDPVWTMIRNMAWTTPWHMINKNPENFQKAGEAMSIRKIYFNVKYLSEKLKDASDIIESVTSVWDDFSSEYGGVYKFKIEYDDVGSTLCIREEGFTHDGLTVEEQIRAQMDMDKGESTTRPNAFVFPTWEAGSIVKSQDITAKLPSRMQLAAMHGINVKKGQQKDEEKDLDSSSNYDDIAAKAWGRFSKPISKVEGETIADMKEKRYKDRITGDIDYPSRGNRLFGRWDADINLPLYIGDRNENNRGEGMVIGPGTIIGATIAFKVEERGRLELSDNVGELVPEGNTIDLSTEHKAANIKGGYQRLLYDMNVLDASKAQDTILGQKEGTVAGDTNDQVFYTWVSTWEGTDPRGRSGPGSGKGGYRRMKREVLFQLQALLRGNAEGVLNNTNPLIPIEFSMDIDGTGALFPGNSFHSSYLQKRYKEESIFQMVAVGHKVDPSGWTTTIKGQIRAIAQKSHDKRLPPLVPIGEDIFVMEDFTNRNLDGTKIFSDSQEIILQDEAVIDAIIIEKMFSDDPKDMADMTINQYVTVGKPTGAPPDYFIEVGLAVGGISTTSTLVTYSDFNISTATIATYNLNQLPVNGVQATRSVMIMKK